MLIPRRVARRLIRERNAANAFAAALAVKVEAATTARNIAEGDLFVAQLRIEHLEERLANITTSTHDWAAEREALKVELRATRNRLAEVLDLERRASTRDTQSRERAEKAERDLAEWREKFEGQPINVREARRIRDDYERELAAAQEAAELANRRADSWEREAMVRGEERDGWRNRAKEAEERLAALEGKPRQVIPQSFYDGLADDLRRAEMEQRRQAKIEWDTAARRGAPYRSIAFHNRPALCTLPPMGYWCPLGLGHDGPCPTRSTNEVAP